MTFSLSIHLLICMSVFLQSCCRGLRPPCNASEPDSESQRNKEFVCKDGLNINSTNWYLNLEIKQIEDEIKSVVKNFEYEDNVVENLLMAANIHILHPSNPVRAQLIDSQFFRDGYPAYRNAELIIEVSRLINDKYCQIYRTSAIKCSIDLKKIKLDKTSLGEICLSEYYNKTNKTTCLGKNFMYRSPDGSCNNLKRSSLGKSTTAYKRLLPPVYLDGVNTVRTIDLPKPRYLSNAFATKDHTPDPVKTMSMAYWAIFIGHDLSHTAMSNMRKSKKLVNCCHDRNGTDLPSSLKHKLCMPIEMSSKDYFYNPPRSRITCMNYVRSVPAMRPECTFGPREQMNQATHYLDGSMIYGSTEQQMWSLRTKSNGQLLTNKICISQGELSRFQYMPLESDPNACQYGEGSCYRSGDTRANGLPQLTVMHTLWVREHNRLAKQLAHINPHWDDERIFQEARKIVIASIQHITYAEWLPALLGENYTKKNQLELLTEGYSNAYNDTIDPAVSNSFATAILPFSNSMISDKINLYSEDREKIGELDLNNHYNQPNNLMVHYLDLLVRGLSTQNTLKVHMGFSSQLSNYLYMYRPKLDPYYFSGFDIFSLDIQRSRDHGIPSYTYFRKYCGLKDIEYELDLLEIMNPINSLDKLKQYSSWDDIDLLTGVLFEKHVDDAMVGPTMRCIIREQFIRTRIADRYFYDLPTVFNKYQLAEIRKVTLARIFCDSSDNITTMQKRVFYKPTTPDFQLCNSQSIPKINLNHWIEKVDTVQ